MNPIRKKILKESALAACLYTLIIVLGDLIFALYTDNPISEEMKSFWRYALQTLILFMIYYGFRCLADKDL